MNSSVMRYNKKNRTQVENVRSNQNNELQYNNFSKCCTSGLNRDENGEAQKTRKFFKIEQKQ